MLDSCDEHEDNDSKTKLSRAEIEAKIENINKRLAELELGKGDYTKEKDQRPEFTREEARKLIV